MSQFGLSHYKGDNLSDSWIAKSVQHSPCKWGEQGLSPGLTAHFSHPVTFDAQPGAMHACHAVCFKQKNFEGRGLCVCNLIGTQGSN